MALLLALAAHVGLLWYLNFIQTPTVPTIEHCSRCPVLVPKVLGIVDASAGAKAAARLDGLTSRVNTMLSISMLYCMVAQNNAGL